MNKIKELISNGWTTLMGLLKLEWINFKNWRGWTALRALYLIFAILCLVYTCWYGLVYFIVCVFFKTEPLLWILSKLGFSEIEI